MRDAEDFAKPLKRELGAVDELAAAQESFEQPQPGAVPFAAAHDGERSIVFPGRAVRAASTRGWSWHVVPTFAHAGGRQPRGRQRRHP